ncbi:alpha/beta-hydrolase [Neolentinus lepideus HHB14362 ss-1]|uniref:Alpha/beta-hydrolase n=1 Tax=Neolentinus lepideus HHB14362 ss-1 TaxID=1314782 RepID=A0A165R541_9AGAM|nr:alpha/beta-hydrolase [Neolentinus lepideus HHB14362 ss-1]
MYLRDGKKVIAAIKEAKAGNVQKAIGYLEDSDADIQEIAAFWDFDYVTICDLFEHTTDGQKSIVGPFCGAFSSKDKNKPFTGIAFKGTTTQKEWNTNIDRDPKVTGDDKILWNTNVSKGIFNALFGTYGDSGVPMDHIMEFIEKSASHKGSTRLVPHSTGHSLGASYATLCYSQLLLYYSTNPVEWTLGDMYNYGSPRIGEDSFAARLRTAVRNAPGSTWRIVNANDSVTSVPPVPKHLYVFEPLEDDPRIYIHVDTAYHISTSTAPVLMDSEIGRNPGPAPKTVEYLQDVQHQKDHKQSQYWEALRVANGITGA